MKPCARAVAVLLLLLFGKDGPSTPSMFPCLTYIERNLRVDCEFPPTYKTPGPYCEYKQDSRLVGSTRPGIQPVPELKRRANVTLVHPTLCRLIYARMPGTSDEKAYTYTCRVYQGSVALENSMALHPLGALFKFSRTFSFSKTLYSISIYR
uniref:Si:ch211-215c18.3 n=1 Tax=Scleropages formosus TaxID=113540 RepID=A0A8C9RGK9_SCLFO